jgi:SAM-dependent methyltransferase
MRVGGKAKMAMNLECILHLQRNGWLGAQKNRMLDIGLQNVYFCREDQIRLVIANQGRNVPEDRLAAEAKRLVYFSTPRPGERTTLFSEIAELAGIDYYAFDVCPAPNTEILDLNFEPIPPKHKGAFDVVLNFGTTEHIFNQWNCFSVIHDAATAGGVIYCVLPASAHFRHGYYCYTPLFFRDMARANKYEILDLFVCHAGSDNLLGRDVDLRSQCQLSERGAARASEPTRQFNIHAILRKTESAPFRCGLEVATAHSVPHDRASERYVHLHVGQRSSIATRLRHLAKHVRRAVRRA